MMAHNKNLKFRLLLVLDACTSALLKRASLLRNLDSGRFVGKAWTHNYQSEAILPKAQDLGLEAAGVAGCLGFQADAKTVNADLRTIHQQRAYPNTATHKPVGFPV